MRHRAVLALWGLWSLAASADSTSTTWVCVGSNGHKTIQDHPCDAASSSRELPTVHHDQTLNEWVDRESSKARHRSNETRCRALRESASVIDRRKAEESCAGY